MKAQVFIKKFSPGKVLCFLGLTLFLLTFHPLYAWASKNQAEAQAAVLQGQIIAVDPGHGGYDPGAIGYSGSLEKDINLDLSLKLKDLLTEAGATVILTRGDDSCYSQVKREDLKARADLAEKAGCAIFISVQCNALPEEKCRGAQVFYYPGSALGERLAQEVQAGLKRVLKNSDREALSHREIYILRALSMPAVVMEAGFISNPEEEALLLTEEYREQVAYGVYQGLIAYFQYLAKIESSV